MVRNEYLNKILQSGVVKMIILDKIQSHKQKYKLTIV
ncbi:MAG: Fic family protein [Akkermansia muciniphila]